MPSTPSSAALRIAGNFPIWSQIRRDRNSLGFRFIDSYGHELDEAHVLADRMLASMFLQTLDEGQISEIEAAPLPKEASLSRPYAIYAGDMRLKEIKRLVDFYQTDKPAVYIEKESWSAYFRNAPGEAAFYQGASIWPLEKSTRPVWNDFDEFGLLLGLERIPGESNRDFRIRMMTVGQIPPGASRSRLEIDWARRLGLVIEQEWPDDSEPIEIENAHHEACFVDGRLYPSIRTEKGALLEPPEDAEGKTRSIVALARLRSAPLWQRHSDTWLYSSLYDEWGEGRPAYYALAREVASKAPVLWGEVKPGESFWEAGKAAELGLGHIPSFMDPVLPRR